MTRLYVQSVDAEAAIQNLKSLAKEISEEVLLRAAERAADEAIDEVRTKLQNNGFGVRPPKIATSERKLRKGSAFPFTSLVEFQHYALAWESYIEPMGKDMVRVVVTPVGSHPTAGISFVDLGRILDMGTRHAQPRRHFDKIRKLLRDAVLREIREEVERVVSRH